MAIVTLTTDFGAADPYVGIVKGVMLSIAPDLTIVDLTHDVPPQDVIAGALSLEAAVEYFPAGTVHLAIVDPEVGSARRAVAIRTDRAWFVGPDNGLFELALRRLDGDHRAVELTNPEFHRPRVSATFHGRDVFAPVAAHMAAGGDFEALGNPVDALTPLNAPSARVDEHAIAAHVLYVDRFGNLITDLTVEQFDAWLARWTAPGLQVIVGETPIGEVRRTFADVGVGEAVAYRGSGGRLEIAVRNGSAAKRFGAERGFPVWIGGEALLNVKA